MIFFFGSGRRGGFPVGLLLVLGVFLLLTLGDGSGGLLLFPLVFFGIFLLVPFMMFRALARGAGSVLQAPTGARQRPVPAAPAPVDPADVVSLRDRLAHDISTLDHNGDPVLRQALADASERHGTCTSLLERARSQDQLRTAWLAAAEGLHATRLVRERLGLDPGPVPVLPDAGPHLQQRARVTVGGHEHVGAPAYEPGRPHWFPGGQVGGGYVPGGWYATPFWPGSLVLGVLGGFALSSLAAGAASAAWGGAYGDGLDGGWDDGSGGWDGGGGWGGGDDWSGGGGWGGGGDFGGGGDW